MHKKNQKTNHSKLFRHGNGIKRLSRLAALLAAASLTPGFIHNGVAADGNSSDPVLDLLRQKGIITDAEASKVKAELDGRQTNEMAQMPASKWMLGKGLKDIELFGDVRLRYENRQVQGPLPEGGRIDLNRLRYALRFGLRGDAFDNFYYGFRLDTAANPRSPWVTFGTSSSGSPYQGPFGKSTAGLNVGQLFLGWQHPDQWINITAGKMAQPLYTTTMVWDSDFNPEGMAEHLKYKVGDATLFANLGQFLYQDTNPTSASKGFFGAPFTTESSALVFMLAWQAGFKYEFRKDVSFQVAPVLYNYVNHGLSNQQTPGFAGTFVGQGATTGIGGVPANYSGFPNGPFDGFSANQTGINDLLVLEVPWEVDFPIASLNARVFGDYAQNLEGAQRAEAAAGAAGTLSGIVPITSPQTHDNHAYQIGLAVGSDKSLGLVYGVNARKGAWEARAYWQHVEQYALDPNLIDSDWFEGRGNLEGIYSAFAYNLTANFTTTLRYGYAKRINDELGTGGSNQDIPQMNPIQHYHILQLDLAMRF